MTDPSPTTVLFMCPHNAAKSVAAAALVSAEASAAGLDLVVTTAGTHPDPEVLPVVRAYLEDRELPGGDTIPRRVSENELTSADIVINIGCSQDDLPVSRPMRAWAVRNFSDNPADAFADLERHSASLVQELGRQLLL